MDRTQLLAFTEEIKSLREYINYIEITSQNLQRDLQLSGQDANVHNFTLAKKKKFEYAAIIISLYGLLERYIEKWICHYLEKLPRVISNYADLPEKMRKNHFNASISLADKIITNKLGYDNELSKEEVITNLAKCVSGQQPYRLNQKAFTLKSSGNLKHNKIVELFNSLAIQDLNKQLLDDNQDFKNYLRDKRRDEISERGSFEAIKPEILYKEINDLVDRRNEIAHGGEVLDILSQPEMILYLDFLEKYCTEIFKVLETEFSRHFNH
jgi:hypothetical protein